MAFTYFQKGRMNFVVNFPSILKISVSTFWVESRPGFCISRWTCIVRPRGNIKKQQPPGQFLFARHATENSTSCFHIQIKSIFFTTSHVNPTQIPTKPFPKEAAWPGMTPPLIIHDYICMQFSTILALGKDSCCLGNQKQHKHCAWLDLLVLHSWILSLLWSKECNFLQFCLFFFVLFWASFCSVQLI